MSKREKYYPASETAVLGADCGDSICRDYVADVIHGAAQEQKTPICTMIPTKEDGMLYPLPDNAWRDWGLDVDNLPDNGRLFAQTGGANEVLVLTSNQLLHANNNGENLYN